MASELIFEVFSASTFNLDLVLIKNAQRLFPSENEVFIKDQLFLLQAGLDMVKGFRNEKGLNKIVRFNF
jgi:hypothetical protein